MSYDAGITTTPGGATENTLKPVADTAAGLLLLQHSGTQSAPLLGVYDAAGTTFLGGIGPNASAVWKGLALNVTPRTTNYTTTGTDYYIPVDATAGAVTVTLKPSTGTPFGSQQRISKVDSSANAVTVQRGGADTINGGTSITLTTQYDTAVLQSDGNGAWNAVLPASLAPAVILAPNSVDRNLIQPTGDGNHALVLTEHSVTQTQDTFQVRQFGGANMLALQASGTLEIRAKPGAGTCFDILGPSSGSSMFSVNEPGGYAQAALNVQSNASRGLVLSPSSLAGSDVLVCQDGDNFNPAFMVDPLGNIRLERNSSIGFNLVVAKITAGYLDNTDATYKGRMELFAQDFNAARLVVRLEADGTNPRIGFLGAAAVVRPASTDDLRQALINLGLYTTGGASPLDLNGGSLKTAGLLVAEAAKTANYTLVDADHTVTADATGGAFTVTLPTASGRIGKQFTVKRINSGANAVTLQGNGAETIDGSNTQSLSAQWQSFTVEAATSTTWIIV